MTIAERLLFDGEMKGWMKVWEEAYNQGYTLGYEQGYKQGYEEGMITQARKNLLRLGAIWCGCQPTVGQAEMIASITDLSKAEMLIDRVLNITSWEELLEGIPS